MPNSQIPKCQSAVRAFHIPTHIAMKTGNIVIQTLATFPPCPNAKCQLPSMPLNLPTLPFTLATLAFRHSQWHSGIHIIVISIIVISIIQAFTLCTFPHCPLLLAFGHSHYAHYDHCCLGNISHTVMNIAHIDPLPCGQWQHSHLQLPKPQLPS